MGDKKTHKKNQKQNEGCSNRHKSKYSLVVTTTVITITVIAITALFLSHSFENSF
jgi:hypothetical protein